MASREINGKYKALTLIRMFIVWAHVFCLQFPTEGAILVFLPGMAEITTMFDQLQGNRVVGGKNKHRTRIIPLHSTLSSEEQHIVFK